MDFHKQIENLEGRQITVELKNDLSIRGTLQTVDRYMNIRLVDIEVENVEQHPQLLSTQNCFVRGSTIRYISMSENDINLREIQETCSRSAVVKRT